VETKQPFKIFMPHIILFGAEGTLPQCIGIAGMNLEHNWIVLSRIFPDSVLIKEFRDKLSELFLRDEENDLELGFDPTGSVVEREIVIANWAKVSRFFERRPAAEVEKFRSGTFHVHITNGGNRETDALSVLEFQSAPNEIYFFAQLYLFDEPSECSANKKMSRVRTNSREILGGADAPPTVPSL
jgi:hypothetical protein